jgi:hypothetical protein
MSSISLFNVPTFHSCDLGGCQSLSSLKHSTSEVLVALEKLRMTCGTEPPLDFLVVFFVWTMLDELSN